VGKKERGPGEGIFALYYHSAQRSPAQIRNILQKIRFINFFSYRNGLYLAILLKWFDENPDRGANLHYSNQNQLFLDLS